MGWVCNMWGLVILSCYVSLVLFLFHLFIHLSIFVLFVVNVTVITLKFYFIFEHCLNTVVHYCPIYKTY